MPRPNQKYYLSSEVHPEREVTEQEFIRAEQAAGFHSKFGRDHVATGGFSRGDVSGRVVYVDTDVPTPAEKPACGCHMDDWGEFHPCVTCETKHQAQETTLLAQAREAETSVPEPEPDAGEADQRRSDHIFYTRQLLARAAKVMEVEPESISWFDVVDWMEEHHGVKP